MSKSIVTIKLSDLLTGSKVWIDGKEIHDIGAIHVEHVAGDISKVSLVLVPKAVIIEGEAEVDTLRMNKAHRHPYENLDCHCDNPASLEYQQEAAKFLANCDRAMENDRKEAEVHTLRMNKEHRHPYEKEDCYCDHPEEHRPRLDVKE